MFFQVSEDGGAQLVVTKNSGLTQRVDSGTQLGCALLVDGEEVAILEPDGCDPAVDSPSALESCQVWRLLAMVDVSGLPDPKQVECLQEFLAEHHQSFGIEPGERGETDLVEMKIAILPTDSQCHPFIVRQEVARQLQDMQRSDVIQPSSSPWVSPIVMVRKKDGTHRFRVDRRALNALTKPDLYPLPRIDDLLEQLGESRYFSTLDLASGYWQIGIHPESVEKTAFVVPQGLFEFRVMPLNAPSVFQRLMNCVLVGLNPCSGPDFVALYIDDVLVFSHTLEDHLKHLKLAITRLQEAGLKLKLSKCHFIREEVEYLSLPGSPSPCTN